VREQELIYVHWKKNNRGEYKFFCDNKSFSDYTVEVSFQELINLQTDVILPARIEVAPGKAARVSELQSLAEEYGDEAPPKDWYCLNIHVHAGDTVYAARRGRVTNTREHADLQDSGYSYSSDDNYIEIEHNDCTFGKYSVFRDDAVFVHPGDWVEAYPSPSPSSLPTLHLLPDQPQLASRLPRDAAVLLRPSHEVRDHIPDRTKG
jgi:hypothetical protein